MLKRLAREEFDRRAAQSARVAVFKEFIADRETPVAALSRLGEDEECFLLESVAGGETRGRFSFLGIEPCAKVEGADALESLRSRFAECRYVPAPELPPFQGGAVGYIAYDAVTLFEPRVGVRGSGSGERETPPMSFLVCDTFLVFDNVRDTVTAVVIADASAPDAYDDAMRRIDAVYDKMLSAESIARVTGETTVGRRMSNAKSPGFSSEMTKDEFCAIVGKCKDAIAAGEVIQIVPSQKFTAKTEVSGLALYRALRMVNPSPYNFFMRIGGKTLVGSSPEELVKLSGRTASTSPIAGTRPRGETPVRDAELERELKSDPKEMAEHTMLVDLGRNDLGRVCEIGSVKVDSFARVERYSHVMHLVSTVTGTLAPEEDGLSLLKSTFPAGTLSGAPKVRAMELISQFEKSPRGIYGGAAGYFSLTGDMDFAIVIRTLVKEGATLTMRSGAGIVADSNPEREYEETVNKAKAVFEAVKFAEELR
ncbi:MAG: anthranilate synthase component I family protein [Kiritimatiellae bacterium]|nr:anthranilate synthase component I family protein [Kiritimatiellia bacterium]